MAVYHVNNRLAGTQQNLGTSFKTIVALTAATATLCRGKIIELSYGSDGAPNATDCQIVYDLSRQTAAAAPVPRQRLLPIRDLIPRARSQRREFTAEGTITAASSLWTRALNQRASQQWFANPGQELMWPATNLAGVAFRALSPTYAAPVLVGTVHAEE